MTYILIIFLSLFNFACQVKTDRQTSYIDLSKQEEVSQVDSFLITPTHVGLFNKGMTIQEAMSLFPKQQVVQKRGYGEFEDDIYYDYQFYDPQNNHLLTLTPTMSMDMKQKINRVLIIDSRFRTNKKISLKSTYADLKKQYEVINYSPDMDHIVLTVDELNAWLSISKDYLEKGWWNEKEKKINPDKIPADAKFDSFVIWWN